MKKLEFKQEHFFKVINHNLTCGVRGDPAGQYASISNVISVAQAKHDEFMKELLDGAIVVYGHAGSTYWRPIEDAARPTLKALLIDVKEVEKKCEKHEPMGVFDRFDQKIEGAYRNRCTVCGVEIEPTGWAAK